MNNKADDFVDGDGSPKSKSIEEVERGDDEVFCGRLYGEATTFGSEPWYTRKNWWKIPTSGETNDVRSQFGTLGRLSCAGTSLRGNRHRLQGGVNQDAFSVVSATSKEGTEYLIVVVCDGMGSAEYSAYSARMAAHACSSVLTRGLKDLGTAFFSRIYDKQAEIIGHLREKVLAYRRGAEIGAPRKSPTSVGVGDLQTTLSFAIIGPSDTENPTVFSAWIGDSPIVAIQDGVWTTISREAEGAGLYSSASDGLLTTDFFKTWEGTFQSGDSLLLATDGVGNFLEYNGSETALGRDLRRRWALPVQQLSFVRDLSFEVQSADDDRTAVMVWIS